MNTACDAAFAWQNAAADDTIAIDLVAEMGKCHMRVNARLITGNVTFIDCGYHIMG